MHALSHCQTILYYIMVVSFIGDSNRIPETKVRKTENTMADRKRANTDVQNTKRQPKC
jgi:hypothetical protein